MNFPYYDISFLYTFRLKVCKFIFQKSTAISKNTLLLRHCLTIQFHNRDQEPDYSKYSSLKEPFFD